MALDQDGFISSLKDVSDPLIGMIELLGVDAVKLAHPAA